MIDPRIQAKYIDLDFDIQKPTPPSLHRKLKALNRDTRPPRKQNRFLVGVKFKP